MSAWCPRLATKKRMRGSVPAACASPIDDPSGRAAAAPGLPPAPVRPPGGTFTVRSAPSSNTGVITVTSGRWVPPLYGAFTQKTSPGFILPAFSRMTVRMLSLIEPRWMGMCGAFATSMPSGSKIAQEKSSRSLMLTEYAVFSSVRPICSAIDMNLLLKTSSITGSQSVPTADSRSSATTRSRTRSPLGARCARQPGSTTVVAVDSSTIAGPSTASPAPSVSRRKTGVSRSAPPTWTATFTTGSGGGPPPPARVANGFDASSTAPTASTEAASITSAFSGITKPLAAPVGLLEAGLHLLRRA